MASAGILRFTRGQVCPACGGCDHDGRGQGHRCHGYWSSDRMFFFCARDEYAGQCRQDPGSGCYIHNATGPCRCGVEHAPAAPKPGRNGKHFGDIDQVYKYYEKLGTVLFEVVRFKNPKDFRQRRPLGNGQYAWDLKGITPVLYRLPELMAADRAATVYVLEGEKDVDNLVTAALPIKIVATCNPMGAEKWRHHYSDDLHGRDVAIIVDNDDKGRTHGQKVAASLYGKAASIKVVELPGLPDKGDVSDFLDAGGTLDQLRELVARTPDWQPPSNGTAAQPSSNGVAGPPPSSNGHAHHQGGKDDRPEILISPEEHLNTADAVKALQAEPKLFQRGPFLATILRACKPKSKKGNLTRPDGGLRISMLPAPQIRRLMTVHAIWLKSIKDKNGDFMIVPASPPGAIVDQVATLGEWKGIRPLEGITETPTIRPDGSLISTPGYDEETGLWYEPNGEFPTIPVDPTQADIQAAIDKLFGIVADFPFASGNGKATWLAALVTPLVRWAIDGPTPLFLFDANTAGSGKSKLCDLISIITTGRVMARSDYPDDNTEMQKTLLSIAVEGDRTILFDNVESGGKIGGSALDKALTSMTVKGRILGKTGTSGEVPFYTVIFATGNNLGLKGDVLRRIVPCRLESPEERPEERSDFRIGKDCECGCKGDLLAHTKRIRPELVCAALTIVHGFIKAGSPDRNLVPMDYPAWCNLVRNAVHWATRIDPCEDRKALVANDEETNALKGLVSGWKELCESEKKSALSAAAAVEALERDPKHHDTLRAILSGWSRDGRPSARSIGNRLNKIRGRNIGGSHFEFSTSAGNREWNVRTTNFSCPDAPGDSGDSGDSVSNGSNFSRAHAYTHAGADPCPCADPCAMERADTESPESPESPKEVRTRRRRVEV